MNQLNRSEIVGLLDIVDPFLMIDSVSEIEQGSSGLGTRLVKKTDWYYGCHFVGKPLMPGVLQTETMLQTLVTVLCSHNKIKAKDCLINKTTVNFFEPVTGAGNLSAQVNCSREINGMVEGKAKLIFNGKKVAQGFFRFVIKANFGMRGQN